MALRAAALQQLEQLDLADMYGRAAEAQTSGEWTTAATLFSEIVVTDSDYRDAATRHQQCQIAQRIADLQDRLRHQSDTGAWQAIIDVSAELADLDPAAADTNGLVKKAREMLESRNPSLQADIEISLPRSGAATSRSLLHYRCRRRRWNNRRPRLTAIVRVLPVLSRSVSTSTSGLSAPLM